MSRPRTAPKPPATLAEIATARATAERLFTSARGSLITAAQTYRRELPHRVAVKLEEYEQADDRFAAMKELHRSRTVAEHVESGNLESARRMARISALIAAHVMGARLVEIPGQAVFRWMTTDDSRKHRAVTNYAADAGAIDKAIRSLMDREGVPFDVPAASARMLALGDALVERLRLRHAWTPVQRETVADVMTATPLEKALAILDTLNIRETDDPPTVAE